MATSKRKRSHHTGASTKFRKDTQGGIYVVPADGGRYTIGGCIIQRTTREI